ncbi:MAG: PP2C family protein-serine/threonine phosphatase [Solirubrobacterales bacterium]
MIQAAVPENEVERLAAVRRYDVLDTPPDGSFDQITSLAATHFDVPIAIVSIVDTDRIWFKSRHGIDTEQVGRDPGLCASAIIQDDPWVIEDAKVDPRTIANPLVAGELGLGFYAGAPLITHDGYNLGTLCVIDRAPREFSDREAETLAGMARLVVDQLELHLSARRTVDHEQVLREQAERTARSLQEGLLPSRLPQVAGADLASLYLPADADVVGGDFFDVFEFSGGLFGVVGDVSGKGPEAATVTALARHTIRAATLTTDSPEEILEMLNRAMYLGGFGDHDERFCTVMVVRAVREAAGLSLTVAGAGHPAALHLHSDGSISALDGGGPPVGWFEDAEFGERQGMLARGERVVLYTDGITEARTEAGMLGVEGLSRILGVGKGRDAEATVDAIREAIRVGEISIRDDVAALVIGAT